MPDRRTRAASAVAGRAMPPVHSTLLSRGLVLYVSHMPIRTTVYLDAAEYRRLKALARAEGRSAAELLREAVAEYTARRSARLRPRSLGAGGSGRNDLSESAEDLLSGMGRPG